MPETGRFDVGYEEIAAMPPGVERAVQYAVCGLLTDGAHHKQWCLEEVLKSLGEDPRKIAASLPDYSFEEGIAP